ncbi:hypothetical protein C2S53_009553 [Perilla frutescens var. hirtella]|uniref:Uncharacterized protein n=1 Tax=Perilla frutescens var. hirtella TaxID=608512 RepID=A0AAD4JBK0_PERFH|nr:hypothetical protein C2S53_009553 [Perilla frutescens var. hirtella]
MDMRVVVEDERVVAFIADGVKSFPVSDDVDFVACSGDELLPSDLSAGAARQQQPNQNKTCTKP